MRKDKSKVKDKLKRLIKAQRIIMIIRQDPEAMRQAKRLVIAS